MHYTWLNVPTRYKPDSLTVASQVGDVVLRTHDTSISTVSPVLFKKQQNTRSLLPSPTMLQAGATILGKVQLLPACMACDRPFVVSVSFLLSASYLGVIIVCRISRPYSMGMSCFVHN